MASLDTNALELPTLGKGGTYNYLRFKQNINGRVKMAKRPKYSADVIADQVTGLVKKMAEATQALLHVDHSGQSPRRRPCRPRRPVHICRRAMGSCNSS
ncbi:MAG: hypothetical protein R2693_11975 [Nocardioidaceae bacterium]